MALAIFEALDRLANELAVAGLPTPSRNDMTLQGFAASAQPDVGWKFDLSDDAVTVAESMLGDPPHYELNVSAEVMFAVEGEPGPARDAVFRAGIEALRDALFPSGQPLAIEGVFDDLTIGDADFRHIQSDDAKPVEALIFTVSMLVSASTPFG